MARILMIDDDARLAEVLGEYFRRFDLQLENATRPGDGLDRLGRDDYDLLILDIMLPEMDGFEVLRRLRRHSDIPVIMLTARGEVTDRIVGLELGADDYLPKPFEPRELVARIQNILKRSRGPAPTGALTWPGLTIDTERQRVVCHDRPLDLTSREYQLLALLAGAPGRPFSRDEILNHLRGIDADVYSRAVDILVSRLRHKLRPLECIRTHWGAGYSFTPPGP